MKRRFLALVAGFAALNVALWLATGGLALGGSLGTFLFGPGFVRAEVVRMEGGQQQDLRVDRGRVRAVGSGTLTLRELNGDVVAVPIAAGAHVTLNGVPTSLSAIRRGMLATTIRPVDGPADTVQVRRR